MKRILMTAKALALRAGAKSELASSWIVEAAEYLQPMNAEAAERLGRAYAQALHAVPDWGRGDRSAAVALYEAGQNSDIKLNLSESVRDFIAQGGGIEVQLTLLVDSANEPAASAEAPSNASGRIAINTQGTLIEGLTAQLVGQDAVVASIAKLSVRIKHPYGKQSSPCAVLFFAGSPAIGKTLAASLIADALQGDWKTLLIDMARMQSDDTSGAWLVGLRQPYAGAGPGQLTKAVQEHPRTVVVFDNFHAAHPRVQDALLPVFDSGFLRDDYTQKEVDFRQSILVFTSNLGAEIFARPDFLAMVHEDPVAAERTFLEALANETTLRNGNPLSAVSPELLSRLSRSTILLFSPLPFAALVEIARKAVTEEVARIEQSFGCRVAPLDDALLQAQLLALSPQVDARRATSALTRNLFAPLEDALLDATSPPAEVRFVLDPSVATALSRWATDEGLNELRRKQRGMSLSAEMQRDDAVLTIAWRGGEIRRVARSVDFDGPGAIRIEVPEVAFDKIAGHDRIKMRLREVAELLRRSDVLKNYGAYPSRGMLLHGRPGTGKTMMAKAFANYCDLPFIATSGSELLNASFLRRVIKRAREYAPAIVFVDELDALGRRDMSGYTEPINELLAAIDGFDTHSGTHLFVIAATNYPQRVDPALLRAGRIDMHVELRAPDRGARAFFLDQIVARSSGEIDKERLLDISGGMTGAELERVKREAALLAMREGVSAPLTERHVVEAIYMVKYGERYARPIKMEREQLAFHEAGHAVCAAVLNPEQRIEQVSIVARGDALGFVSYIDDEEMPHITVREVREAIAVKLSGRIAEIIACDGEEGVEAGAEDDLRSATALCKRAIAYWGMDEDFGMLHIAAVDGFGDPQASSLLHGRIRAWLEDGRKLSERVLRDHWPQVEEIATALLKDEVLDGSVVARIVARADSS